MLGVCPVSYADRVLLRVEASGLLGHREIFWHGADLPPGWDRAIPAKQPPWLCPRVGGSKMQCCAHGQHNLLPVLGGGCTKILGCGRRELVVGCSQQQAPPWSGADFPWGAPALAAHPAPGWELLELLQHLGALAPQARW